MRCRTMRFSICLLATAITLHAAAQSKAELRKRTEIIRDNIGRHFYDRATGYYKEFTFRDSNDKKTWSYLWPLCGLIQAANECDAAGGSTAFIQTVLNQLTPYYDASPPTPGYNSYILEEGKEERFYDDNQWIGIACIDAHLRTKDERMLATAKEIYRFMMTGFDTAGGGGLYWKEGDLTTKNTCSNGPGAVLALKLYKATGKKAYLDTALLLYNWTNKTLRSPEGVYYDHLRLPSRQVDKRLYTYNAGTMLESAVLLYEITRNKAYLQEANAIAAAAYKTFFKKGRWPDHYWFNTVLLRGYLALQRHNPSRQYIAAFFAEGEAIWKSERDEDGLIGKHKKKNLLDQAAVLEMYARLAADGR